MTVRDATPDDAAACRDVYAPYVTGTAVSFETEPPTAAEMAGRIAAAQERHSWLVLETDGAALTKRADQAMYVSKQGRRGEPVLWAQDLAAPARR